MLDNSPTQPLSTAFVLGFITIAGAWVFELVIGLAPCPMCLTQRWPYYIGLPILAITLIMARNANRSIAMICAVAAALLFFGGALYAGFHSGIEWHFWEGPSECSGGEDLRASIGNLLADLKKAKVVSCVDAAWRFWGLSLAGYNVIISTMISGLSFVAFLRLKKS